MHQTQISTQYTLHQSILVHIIESTHNALSIIMNYSKNSLVKEPLERIHLRLRSNLAVHLVCHFIGHILLFKPIFSLSMSGYRFDNSALHQFF
jgi:hypothetical protein